jgi:hypothetical protein
LPRPACRQAGNRQVIKMEGGDFVLKVYNVNIQKLSANEKLRLREQLELVSFMVTEKFENNILIAYEAYWDSKEDFHEAIKLPKECDCLELS